MFHLKITLPAWWRKQQQRQGELILARYAPCAATVNPSPQPPADQDTGVIPALLACLDCSEDVFADEADHHGRCKRCSAIAAANEMVLLADEEEAYRLEGVRQAIAERATASRGAGALPRLPDEPAPQIPFEAHATETLPEVVAETALAAVEFVPIDYVALGYVAAATDDDDATLRAQIMLSERHDAPGLMAGISAGLRAFTARQGYAAHQAAQRASVSA